MTDSPPAPENASSNDEPRRNFLVEIGSIVIGGVVGSFGFVVGLVTFLDPLSRKKKVPAKYAAQKKEGPEGFIQIGQLSSLEINGPPVRFPVIADVTNAWNFTPNQPIGAVYAQRIEEKKVLVLHSTCPHAGCSVSYAGDAEQYHCPCHNSAFNKVGKQVDLPGKENPSPRPMDELKVHQEMLEENGEIWIAFQNFHTGIHEKKAKS